MSEDNKDPFTDDQKRELADSMHSVIRENIAKRRSQPLCYSLIHPFLGDGIFKDTCCMCGFDSNVDKE